MTVAAGMRRSSMRVVTGEAERAPGPEECRACRAASTLDAGEPRVGVLRAFEAHELALPLPQAPDCGCMNPPRPSNKRSALRAVSPCAREKGLA
eukprot:CAMPEP_0202393686 /NCGR_PEP_ID=MMETSP1127-20130417/93039_1 /ASSEMBLY_ACC=CAM_ASM_000462 /TAXON_ID=3047 /ORGANISM="Dunaliella tertiolecta, Strain CCMP1320" /LENGTH=93 /DNA_ID=CAMNT_0048996275 /DNA_START=1459 /DNA_END=1738 /DNA_ORIENTATION=+